MDAKLRSCYKSRAMFTSGEVISYIEMCQAEGASLQRGMNFHLKGTVSVILMSLRRGAPYADRIEDNGKILIYEGHDLPRIKGVTEPKKIDQPRYLAPGKPTQNGLFFDAAKRTASGAAPPERVRVYEKIRNGVWVFDGIFDLLDAWLETADGRKVFKFSLRLRESGSVDEPEIERDLPHNRLIPTAVKLEVWKRDRSSCVICGSRENLHFDHVIPYSRTPWAVLRSLHKTFNCSAPNTICRSMTRSFDLVMPSS